MAQNHPFYLIGRHLSESRTTPPRFCSAEAEHYDYGESSTMTVMKPRTTTMVKLSTTTVVTPSATTWRTRAQRLWQSRAVPTVVEPRTVTLVKQSSTDCGVLATCR